MCVCVNVYMYIDTHIHVYICIYKYNIYVYIYTYIQGFTYWGRCEEFLPSAKNLLIHPLFLEKSPSRIPTHQVFNFYPTHYRYLENPDI